MRKLFTILLALLMLCNTFYYSFAYSEAEEELGNVRYPDEVSSEMTDSEYWTNLRNSPNEVLLSLEDISRINSEIVANGSVNHVVDLENVTEIVDEGIEVFDRELYVNGVIIDEKELIKELEKSVETLPEFLYAVTVKRANLRTWPVKEFLGYTEIDPDDELQNSVIEINSPVIISKKSTFHNHTFYFCQTEFLTSWIDSDELAICKDKEEWVNAWKIDTLANDFLVVLEDKIILEPMLYEPEISEVELGLGSRLKLVPESEIPESVGEREGTFFNYVVYVPTRNENGKYVRKVALIPERYNVSIGFLPFTESNLTSVAFELLGNRYSWGGTMKSYDSSLFNRQVYSCFGLRIPTNTTWQKSLEGYAVDISEMTEEEKLEYIKNIPIGSLLYIPGCSMQYIGCIDDMPYVISSIGVFSTSKGELNIRRYYTVSVLPMSSRKKSGETFLKELSHVLNFCR